MYEEREESEGEEVVEGSEDVEEGKEEYEEADDAEAEADVEVIEEADEEVEEGVEEVEVLEEVVEEEVVEEEVEVEVDELDEVVDEEEDLHGFAGLLVVFGIGQEVVVPTQYIVSAVHPASSTLGAHWLSDLRQQTPTGEQGFGSHAPPFHLVVPPDTCWRCLQSASLCMLQVPSGEQQPPRHGLSDAEEYPVAGHACVCHDVPA